MDSRNVYDEVNARYGSIAKSENTSDSYATNVAKAFGYTDEDLANLPEGANLGLGCGNPVALANLREGEIIVDLGCGGGLDVITAARKVGANGVSIGIDMNKDMLKRASTNAAKVNVTNVRFIESPVTKIAILDGTADCVISNCVVNLVPAEEKQLAFHEMHRILKPGGRVAISDILARKELPEQMTQSIALYVGCIAGASQVSEYERYLANAGFKEIRIVDSKSDLNVYLTAAEHGSGSGCCGKDTDTSQCCTPAASGACCEPAQKQSCCGSAEKESPTSKIAKDMAKDLGKVDWNEWAGSFQIYAWKPKPRKE